MPNFILAFCLVSYLRSTSISISFSLFQCLPFSVLSFFTSIWFAFTAFTQCKWVFKCICAKENVCFFVFSFCSVSKSLLLHLMMWLFVKACVSLFAIQTLSFHFALSSFSIFMCFGVYLCGKCVRYISVLFSFSSFHRSLILSRVFCCTLYLWLYMCIVYMDRGGCL